MVLLLIILLLGIITAWGAWKFYELFSRILGELVDIKTILRERHGQPSESTEEV